MNIIIKNYVHVFIKNIDMYRPNLKFIESLTEYWPTFQC